MMYLLLMAGFVLLIKGADFFVEGSSAAASFFKIPSVIIGLTIVAMGTSAPEAAVSLTASLAGNSDISLGNIVGSNIFNLLMVIGICAVIVPVMTNLEILRRDMIWNVAVSALLFILILDGKISRTDGFILLAGMGVYLAIIINHALRHRTTDENQSSLPMSKAILFIAGGLVAIVAGGKLVVGNASMIAAALGMSDTLIGLTIVAIGTSLPELVTSVVASGKGDSGIAIGNAVGSCLFNIMFILGFSSVIAPIGASAELIVDNGILIAVSLAMYLFAKTKMTTSRTEGIFCVLLYAVYTGYIILR